MCSDLPELLKIGLKLVHISTWLRVAIGSIHSRANLTADVLEHMFVASPEQWVRELTRVALLRCLVEAVKVELPHKRSKIAMLEISAHKSLQTVTASASERTSTALLSHEDASCCVRACRRQHSHLLCLGAGAQE